MLVHVMNSIVKYPMVPNLPVDYIPSYTILRLMHCVSGPVTFGIDICNNSSNSSRSSSGSSSTTTMKQTSE